MEAYHRGYNLFTVSSRPSSRGIDRKFIKRRLLETPFFTVNPETGRSHSTVSKGNDSYMSNQYTIKLFPLE